MKSSRRPRCSWVLGITDLRALVVFAAVASAVFCRLFSRLQLSFDPWVRRAIGPQLFKMSCAEKQERLLNGTLSPLRFTEG